MENIILKNFEEAIDHYINNILNSNIQWVGEVEKLSRDYINENFIKSLKEICEENKNLIDYLSSDNKFLEDQHNKFNQAIDNIIGNHLVHCYESSEKELNCICTKLRDVFDVYKNLPLLSQMLKDNQSIIVVGANGVGKSTLIDDIKKDKLFKLFSVSAQKNLFYYINEDYNKINSKVECNELMINNFLKINNEESKLRYANAEIYMFTKLLNYILREHQSCKSDNMGEGTRESILDKINKLFEQIFPYLKIATDSINSKLNIINNKFESDILEYSINRLSDGEKSVLFYLAMVFSVSEECIFVIDEPETHLHIALSTKLWDLILKQCPKHKFIFISHDIQFINSRSDSEVIWCKKYIDINDHMLESIENNKADLTIELLGNRKPILFCEGNYQSNDYQIYNILYGENYYIKPVGGHRKVVEYTQFVNNENELSFYRAIGLIDHDFH